MAEIIIIGGGPAGLSAGIYTTRAGRETLIIDSGDCTACKIDRLDNYLGFPRVYATGDCTGANRQIAIAMGEGADTAINLISELKGTRWVGYGGRFK